MSTTREYSNVWVCTDCYFAHHYGYREFDREPTDDEQHNWKSGYLRGHDLPNMVETADGQMVREWFAGDSDTPCDREPLARLAGFDLSDNVCSEHSVTDLYDEDGDRTGETSACEYCGQTDYETGEQDFSWSACQGCGSTLGGSRYRLAVWERTS